MPASIPEILQKVLYKLFRFLVSSSLLIDSIIHRLVDPSLYLFSISLFLCLPFASYPSSLSHHDYQA